MTDVLTFPLGSAIRAFTSGTTHDLASSGKSNRQTKLVLTAVFAAIIIAMAMWMASDCNDMVNYVLAFFFPLNYIMIRLLAPCRT